MEFFNRDGKVRRSALSRRPLQPFGGILLPPFTRERKFPAPDDHLVKPMIHGDMNASLGYEYGDLVQTLIGYILTAASQQKLITPRERERIAQQELLFVSGQVFFTAQGIEEVRLTAQDPDDGLRFGIPPYQMHPRSQGFLFGLDPTEQKRPHLSVILFDREGFLALKKDAAARVRITWNGEGVDVDDGLYLLMAAESSQAMADLLAAADNDHITIPSSGHYAAMQKALALNLFERVEGSPYPRAVLDRGGVSGRAELRPVTPEEELLLPTEQIEELAGMMWEQQKELSDKDADALDGLSALWLKRTRTPTDRILVHVDELLRMRGLKPHKGGGGRRGGFRQDQRYDVFASLYRLQNIWLEVDATIYEKRPGRRGVKAKTKTLRSRAFVMIDQIGQKRLDGTMGIMEVEAILVTPGTAFGTFLFGPGRQLALMSANALNYDPYRQRYEKRLLRYLTWQWRVTKGLVRVYKVGTLLEEIGLETGAGQPPSRIRDRFEKCLDTLLERGDLAAWQYDGFNEENLPRKGWMPQWLEARVLVEAPEAIKEGYLELIQKATKELPKPDGDRVLGKAIRDRRQALGLTQAQLAEDLHVSAASISRVEAGKKLSRTKIQALKRWLVQTEPKKSGDFA